jgi:hypothetical protein
MTDTEYREKLFQQLDTLQHRNRRFMRGALLALAILFASTLLQQFVVLPQKADHAEVQLAQQREGRRVAIGVLCGGLQAVIDAGRAQIVTTIQPPRFRRNLERLGLPDAKTRRRVAEKAAEAYATAIARATEKQSGVEGVVDEGGNLRCDRLVVRAHAR